MLNLGNINEPLFIFGGPYSNIQATENVLDLARQQGFSKTRIICTGDVVAYCGNPTETTTAIRESGIHVIMGNCEESLGFEWGDCGCGFTEDSACDVLSRQWFDYASSRITSDDRAWMRALPRFISFEMAGRRLVVAHGNLSDISGWVFNSTAENTKAAELALARHDGFGSCDGIIAGHCGLPFFSTTDNGRLWFNAGVIGMPANDGTPRGWYGIVEPHESGGIRTRIESFDYDHEAASAAIYSAGLSEGYAAALVSGLWPNMDVLPVEERRDQGQALHARSHHWCGPYGQRLTA